MISSHTKVRILTGMQSSGVPHWGNYFGMIRQSVALQNEPHNECFYFIADLHAFTSHPDSKIFSENQKRTILDWLSLGIDPEKSVFYRQSDIRSHTELTWYLMSITPMGLLNRAHSYKDKISHGLEANVGLFTYPVLMAADILLYDAQIIPVGKDQKQHVEMARDIAQKFNHQYSETFVIPEPHICRDTEIILGIDGHKMSKSYGNTIDIFEEESVLRKKIMSIPTASIPLGKPLNPKTCTIFAYHKLFQNPELKKLETSYKNGLIGFGDSKKQLFELVWEYFRKARERRAKLIKSPHEIEHILQIGAQKANVIAEKKLEVVRSRLGLSPKHSV